MYRKTQRLAQTPKFLADISLILYIQRKKKGALTVLPTKKAAVAPKVDPRESVTKPR